MPRTQVDGIDLDAGVEELEKAFIETKHSKILVYKESIDNIIGYVHHLDLYKKPKSIKSILIPILISNESKPANEMLNEFTASQKSMALVVDEYGGTAGICTVEDIMEEIFGEIEDEHDVPGEEDEKQLDERTFEFMATEEIDYLNEKYDLDLPEGEYETLGGFIVDHLENIPAAQEQVIIDKFEIRILEASEQRIEKVLLKLLE